MNYCSAVPLPTGASPTLEPISDQTKVKERSTAAEGVYGIPSSLKKGRGPWWLTTRFGKELKRSRG